MTWHQTEGGNGLAPPKRDHHYFPRRFRPKAHDGHRVTVAVFLNATKVVLTRVVRRRQQQRQRKRRRLSVNAVAKSNRVRAARLLPGAVVHRVLVGGAGRHQAPAQRPVVGVVEAFPRIGRRAAR